MKTTATNSNEDLSITDTVKTINPEQEQKSDKIENLKETTTKTNTDQHQAEIITKPQNKNVEITHTHLNNANPETSTI